MNRKWNIALGLAAIAAIFLPYAFHHPPTSTPAIAPAYCATEDEVLVTIQHDSYGMKAGQSLCIHIDRIHEQMRATQESEAKMRN